MIVNSQATRAADPEAELVRGIAARDRDSFERLYRLYYRRTLRFLMKMLTRSQDAEDALNETMLVVWSRAAKFDHTAKVSTWIFGIAYRQALQVLRRSRRAAEQVTEELITSGPESIEQAVSQERLHARTKRALLQLSPVQRAVIELTFYEGHSYAEIAEIMRCSTGTIKTRMMHAKLKLRGFFGSEWRGD